jgi:basic membrane protein A and related proteins
MRKTVWLLVSLLVLFSFVAAQCAAPAAAPEAAPAGKASEYKLAAIFPGVITDADYNTLAFVGIGALKNELGVDTAYSESVAVPDVDRVMREYIDAGYNIIWTHGGQFVSQTAELAKQFPDVVFIAEGDAAVENPPDNLWVIDRNFQVGFYAIGALAGLSTKTGKIGYIGGLTLPFSYAEVHAMQQAIDDLGLDVEMKPVWAGDFNDPTKARQVTDAMLSENADFIVGSLNLGMFGLFEAVKAGPEGVLVTAKYTDKTSYAPDQYVTAVLYDFEKPLIDIVTKVMEGEKGGYYPLGFDTGVALQMPLQHVDQEVADKVEAIIEDVKSGKIEVVEDITPIE